MWMHGLPPSSLAEWQAAFLCRLRAGRAGGQNVQVHRQCGGSSGGHGGRQGRQSATNPPLPPPLPTCAPLLSSLCREALHSQCRMLFGTLHVQAPRFELVFRHGRMQSGISLHLRMLTEDARQRSVSSSGSVSSAAVRQASVAGHVLGFLSFCKLAFICSIHTCCCTALSTAVLSAC